MVQKKPCTHFDVGLTFNIYYQTKMNYKCTFKCRLVTTAVNVKKPVRKLDLKDVHTNVHYSSVTLGIVPLAHR
jgi:hypothetical protein